MATSRPTLFHAGIAAWFIEYAKKTDPPAQVVEADGEVDFVIPEDLSTLSDEELTQLHEEAVGHFDGLFGDGSGLTEADIQALQTLTEGIETLLGEVESRNAKGAERQAQAAELATRVRPHSAETDEDPDAEADEDADPDTADEDAEAEDGAAAVVVAGASRRTGDIRVNLGGLRSRQATHLPRNVNVPKTMKDVVLASGEGTGFAAGSGLDWNGVGQVVDRRLASFNHSQYQAAGRSGTHLRQQFGVATIRKPFADDMIVHSNDPAHVDEVLQRARKESRLPGGSLVASGGWAAPSETIYDLCELESRDGLFNLPEIGISRGGISWTTGPSFSEIYNAVGFTYTEAQDEDGLYVPGSPNTEGDKPCYKVEFPDFVEARLNLSGLCITAGLLAQRGYPEVIARTVRGALVAHDHKMSAALINAVVAGSTAITMTAAQVGAVAPILDAIEKQTEHYRYSSRLARSTTLEAVFPFWIHGAIRSDLALRNGVANSMDVTDAQINAWFNSRGVRAQFVYDWQDINGTAATSFLAWPTTVKFLLYAAGTWVKGGSDIITLDTIYDSVLLGQNDYTALFTEEGWLVAKLCFDSRVVTVAIDPSGTTGQGVPLTRVGVKV